MEKKSTNSNGINGRSKRDVHALSEKRNWRRVIATSFRARRIIGFKKGLLLSTYKLINDNFEELETGRIVRRKGILLKRMASGKYKGKENFITLLAKTGHLEFFIKIFKKDNEVDILKGIRLLEEQLKKRDYSFNGIRMKQIHPLLVYEDAVSGKCSPVTPFFREEEVIQASALKGPVRRRILSAIKKFGTEMERSHHILEIAPVNSFYHPATGTVLLFDIYHFVP